jgi:hypothetical protein
MGNFFATTTSTLKVEKDEYRPRILKNKESKIYKCRFSYFFLNLHYDKKFPEISSTSELVPASATTCVKCVCGFYEIPAKYCQS